MELAKWQEANVIVSQLKLAKNMMEEPNVNTERYESRFTVRELIAVFPDFKSLVTKRIEAYKQKLEEL